MKILTKIISALTNFRKPFKGFPHGFALPVAIFVMVAFAAIGTATVALIAGSARVGDDEMLAQQAFGVAEMGLAYTAEQLGADTNWADNAGTVKPAGAGSFTTTFLAKTSGTATVQSIGTVGGVSATVKADFATGTPAAFLNTLYAEENIETTGSSTGVIHGSSVAGGVYSHTGTSYMTFDGTTDFNHSAASVPAADWSYWKGIAIYDLSGNYSFPAGTYSGIYYVSGNVSVTGSKTVVLNGSIIARGDVSFSGSSNVTIHAQGTNPAIVSEGDIGVTGSANLTIDGWVVAYDDIDLAGSANVINCTGGFATTGEFRHTGSGSFSVTYDADRIPPVGFPGGEPSGGGGGSSGPVLSNWREPL